MFGGTFFPPRKRSKASARPAAQRHLVVKRGDVSTACSRTERAEFGCRKGKTSASGKLCCSLSEMFNPLSVAAACSSKLNERQNRLRSARPQALLIRPPNGAWITSCMPPLSSKKRSAMIVVCVGTAPKVARPVATYSTACSAPASSSPHSSLSQVTAAMASLVNCPVASEAALGTNELIFSRNFETCAESSSVRAGASPRQNGIVGGAPCASSTKTDR